MDVDVVGAGVDSAESFVVLEDVVEESVDEVEDGTAAIDKSRAALVVDEASTVAAVGKMVWTWIGEPVASTI